MKSKFNTAFWFGIVFIVVIGTYCWSQKKVSSISKQTAVSSQTQVNSIQKFKVPLGEKPLEIQVPLGMHIGLQVVTRDVPFWVRANHDPKQTDHYPPINSPEYRDKDYGEHLRYIEVWLDPGYQAEIEYYFKPL
ncbi:MAG: hypothetical protein AAB470_03130 [Patescibacteria group bacterium]